MERGETENIINRLKSYNTREEGESYLLSLDLKRKDLEAVAKALDLPYSKKDTIVKIREKIIEGTIGYRLSSNAILSDPLF